MFFVVTMTLITCLTKEEKKHLAKQAEVFALAFLCSIEIAFRSSVLCIY